MSVSCPEGHQSEDLDWCDECGRRIVQAQVVGAPDPAEPSTRNGSAGTANRQAAGASGNDTDCPVCTTTRVGNDRFCEVCGYDFVNGVAPPRAEPELIKPGPPAQPGQPGQPGPPAAPRVPSPAPARHSQPRHSQPQHSQPQHARAGDAPSGWTVEIVADRAFYDRGAEDGVPFPTTASTRIIELGGARSLIGRQNRARGYFPDIDLSAVPEDRGVSRTHAIIDHPPGGSLTITDVGSSNGTWVDDDEQPLARNVPVPLRDGARIYVGSWTQITVRRT